MSEIDFDTLTTESIEVIANQPTINIGTIGHVAHGKTTVVKAISGVATNKFFDELKRNLTIELGYANAKIFRCPHCPEPQCYQAFSSGQPLGALCCHCHTEMDLIRHVSFADCPGHDVLMATMLSGAAIMDAALLLVAANEPCPQPQTAEHLAAVEILRLSDIIILQNKVDLLSKGEAIKHYQQLHQYIQGTPACGSPIIPISAQLGYNIDIVLKHIVETIPVPKRQLNLPARMIIIRSFDVNKPGSHVSKLTGGVAGGSIKEGILRLNDMVEIRPGVVIQQDNTFIVKSIFTEVLQLKSEENVLQFAVPGGLIGVGTRMDPRHCRANGIVGDLLGHVNTLPDVYIDIVVQHYLVRTLVGVAAAPNDADTSVVPLTAGELLKINIGSQHGGGVVLSINGDKAHIKLMKPVCCEIGEKVALSRRIRNHWRLIGWGAISSGTTIDVDTSNSQK
eukprot:TRINITY_DN2873_c0_g7_i1.p1 TRINITY_DN2873_c0_g7~~TRINITY_DN2873_c0_g7_i1.p1  ORF type:complete len:451 (+),score=141.86 TRINITY_DN2873_c0_g7_i1:27-1379(+)